MSGEDGGGFDPDGELATLNLDPQERGLSFSLRPEIYRRLCSACLSVASEAMTIRKCHHGPGAIVQIFSRDVLVTLGVGETLTLFVQDLDSCEVKQQLLGEENSSEGWERIRRTMKLILGDMK